MRNLGEYYYLYVRSNMALLSDAFERFCNGCIEMYELNPAHFLLTPTFSWQTCLRKTEVELELITDVDMLLTVVKGIRMCYTFHQYTKASMKYTRDYHKN